MRYGQHIFSLRENIITRKKKIGKQRRKIIFEINGDVHNLALMCRVILLDPMY